MPTLQERYTKLLTSPTAPNPSFWKATPTPESGNLTSTIVELILTEAVNMRASDIHLEPFPTHTRVRYRIDGKLHPVLDVANNPSVNIFPRIKILANLPTDSVATRKALDGRFSLKINGKDIDFRMATFPTILGEKIALRILNKDVSLVDLKKLGLHPHDMVLLEQITQRQNGLLIVCGPTGSGKTTTLYSILNRLHNPQVNIVTLENPVEYQLTGINQCDIHSKSDEDFAAGLKAILRQDPNIILIGEVRDTETAEIAIRASITGHLVLTSLHSNSAVGTAIRLINMGIERYIVSYAITGAIAQRLVRRLCERCRAPYKVNAKSIHNLCTRFNIPPEVFAQPVEDAPAGDVEYETAADAIPEEVVFYKKIGCPSCSGTGFMGRVGVFEVVRFSDSMREAILNNATTAQLETMARQQGSRSLVQDAIDKARAGLIDVEDIYPILLEKI